MVPVVSGTNRDPNISLVARSNQPVFPYNILKESILFNVNVLKFQTLHCILFWPNFCFLCMSLVNDSLKFTSSDTQNAEMFC